MCVLVGSALVGGIVQDVERSSVYRTLLLSLR